MEGGKLSTRNGNVIYAEEILNESINKIREIIEELASTPQEKGSLGQKIGDLYTMRMDSARQNKDGVKPVLNDLKRVSKVKNTKQWIDLVIQMNSEGIGFGELWGAYISADMMSSKENLLSLSQSGWKPRALK